MAIGDECCLGVSNEEAIRRTTESLLKSATGGSLFEGIGGGLHWEEPTVCAQRTSNTPEENKEVLASENGDLQNHYSPVTRANECSQIHAESEKENQNCSSTEGEPMCASGILCSGVKPCGMSDFALTVSDCSATVSTSASVGIVDAAELIENATISDNNATIDEDSENVVEMACSTKTDQEKETEANVTVEQMEVDEKELINSETREKIEEDERSISPDEGSKCSQSSDNGYASDSSNSDASENELNQAKSADEESSSSDDDSSPDDSPSPPSADESNPFPCVEEVETRTGISFERTLSNNSQNDNCSAFSFASSSTTAMFSVASSGVGYANYGNVNEAACERAQLRSRVMGLLDGGVRLIDDSERCLRRYVLLKTNLNRLRKEVRDERLGVHRRRRHQAMAQSLTEMINSGSGMTLGPRGPVASSPSPGFPYGLPNSISPLAGQISSSSRSASGGFTTACTVSSSNGGSCMNRPAASDGEGEEPPMKRPRYATEENKENYGSTGSLFLTNMHQYSSEASGFYGTSSGQYSSVCTNSNGGYYSTSSQSMYCMNHLTNHYSSSSTNYFTNSSLFGNGSSTQYMSSFNCSNSSQTNNDRISSSISGSNGSSSTSCSSSSNSSGSNSISGGNLSDTSNTNYSSSCAQVDSFSSPVTSSNDAGSSSGPSDCISNTNNGGFFNASNVTPSSCRSVGLSSNLETIIEAIDLQILRGSYGAGTSRPLSSSAPHTSSFGSFSSYSTGGGFFASSSHNQSGSHIFSNTEGSSYHIFGNNRHGTTNSVFGDSNSSNYTMGHSSNSYNPSFSSSTSPYSEGSSSLAPQNPCGRSQLPGNDFQSLVYSSLMASLES